MQSVTTGDPNDPNDPGNQDLARRAVAGALRRRPPRRVWRRTWFRFSSDSDRQLGWGIASAMLAAVIIIAAGYLSLAPPGSTSYSVDMAETGQLRKGDDVRVAGVPVGSVSGVALRRNDVRVTIRVDKSAFIGNQSTAAVKMLTAVGGYYLDIDSLGATSLGDGSIPANRVRLPYTLTETFQTAGPKLGAVDGQPLRESLVQIQQATSGQPGQLRHAITTLSGMVDALGRQKDQIGRFITVVSEYTTAVNENGDRLTAIMQDMSLFLSTASLNVAGYKAFMRALELTLLRIKPLADLYLRDIDGFERQLRVISGQMQELLQKFEPMIDEGKKALARVNEAIQPDGSVKIGGKTVLSSAFCIPIQGVNC
ncbi:Mammalian cell entry related domain protein OS=Tsukamurella paurometabola (strain ATCC 8368 / DSM / CCUG 35730 / CIP 100753 / JCM 10117 / KCTC 9821 / NBRC 16120 / NCIMB 702349 / NCTC 13040) OX=521096 GN=Tpau_4174 PE=4 SV=1 [Tsukamurella paurometabola]|uniref:Mammalian cell entry related domain protein n=1 Tax=Tsukamurella paurometabola (strain ATCC 8368 / DSM 20162 / CCUG 35730 / CIP 100753 / JCM 10117 / KCTC 9821 / NBRC 16120 / NCIMB 702349 / NCTC 13040) TaxID=521096 RepID=D5UP34_TSUPD|nr:MlaD family protein [Tsukamurella paurometabola]ADG80743.1 Mammalian cell entry related domain protein [Tsukamurella paurometabola DSM 20162]SUP40794.1 virulence factor Mce family protein [Tsukamurella paurometabola]